MAEPSHIAILGGGPAGLSTGYYARKYGTPFTIYEAGNRTGGNCITIRCGDFLFDSGAHRFHAQDAAVTAEIKSLMGDDLRKVKAPSQIFAGGSLVDFPLTPNALLRSLGLRNSLLAAGSLLRSRLRHPSGMVSFEDHAVHTYGRYIASKYLTNYSTKLWGEHCARLSPRVSGGRTDGLNLRAFIAQVFPRNRASTAHLDGEFYYPRWGFGTIADRLAKACGSENIVLRSRVTRLFHDGQRVRSLEINGARSIETDEIVSSLPLPVLVRLLDPAPPQEILEAATRLRFRNVILVALFLNRSGITDNASIYFPDREYPFTRIYEPRNRSPEMAPVERTSLVAEIPHNAGDAVARSRPDELVKMVLDPLVQLGWVTRRDLLGTATHCMTHSYPVLELGSERVLARLDDYLAGLSNLATVGRNGGFVYAHLHDMLRSGAEPVRRHLE